MSPLNQSCKALQLKITRSVIFQLYIFSESTSIHDIWRQRDLNPRPFDFKLHTSYARHSAKLTIDIVKRTFIDKCIFILHYFDNIVSKELYHKEWNFIESISNLLTIVH